MKKNVNDTGVDTAKQLSPFGESFHDSTRITKRLFLVLVVVMLCVSGFFVVSSKDHTTTTDLDHPFYMKSGDVFTVQMEDGTMDFSLANMEEVKSKDKDKRRILLTYNYQVTDGVVDVSKLATAASYIDDSAYAVGVDIVPCNTPTDIVYMEPKGVMDKSEIGSLVIDIPKETKCIYTDIGSSLSVSGKPSFVIYEVEKQLGKAAK